VDNNNPDISRLEDKMEKFFDNVLGRENSMVKVAHPNSTMTNNTYRQYRSSFLTLSDMQIPDDYREIFKWCRYFFKFDPLIGSAVRSLAVFPVTDWILNDTEASNEKDVETNNKESEDPSETYKFYEEMLKQVDLYKHMIELGYDYFLYGNCIVFAEPGVKVIRRRNKETNEIYERKEVVWKNIQRLDLTRVRIDRDPRTGDKIYYYNIPENIKRIVKTKKPKEKYERIPEIFKKAVKEKGLVKLKSEYVYQLQMPSESGDTGLWATPPVLHAMKLILYSNILRQAQEAIAYEHIIPKRIYYFQETQEFSPGMDFADLASDFAFELKKQLDDPNYQVISPFPVQQIQHGGQGKALLLVPELEQLQETILAAMGVPREFVFGGVSYSGSTTSLRILENHFITYRNVLSDYINQFLIKRLAEIRGEWETIDDNEKLVTVTLSDLKLQDDIQQKQLMINLNQQGKLPDEVMYEKALGIDSTKTIKLLQSERIRKLQEQFELQTEQMKMQAKMQEIAAQYGQVQPPEAANGPVIPEPAPGAMENNQEDPNAAQSQGEQSGEQGQSPSQGQSPQGQQAQGRPGNENREALSIAQTMMGMTEAQRANVISKLPQAQAQRVLMFYNQIQQQEGAEEQVDMRPYPEQLPPRRAGGV
jgi:hypothetical protein